MIDYIEVGIIGDFVPDLPSHIATVEAIKHTADALSVSLRTSWIPTRSFTNSSAEDNLKSFHGLWGAPGDYMSMGGALHAIKYARKQGIPFVGT
jgi:CTP synthase (UTP-ammonia lyase)